MKAKKVVLWIVGLLVLQMLLFTGGTGSVEAKEATEEETLYLAMQEDMPNFNYFDLASNTVWKDYVLRFCFDSISGLDPAGNVYPALAESWDFDEDNLKVTVHLREGVKFHDGAEMTADDVVFTYTVLRDGTTYSSSIIDAFDADGDGMVSQEEIDGTVDADGDGDYEGVKKIDNYTVEMTMAKPYGQFFLTTLGIPIIPKHIWENHLSEDGTVDTLWGSNEAAAIGTGPFYYAGGKANVYRELKIFEDYWGKDFTTPAGYKLYPTEVKRIYYKLYSNLDTAILALKTGQVDHIPWAVTPGYVPDLISNPNTDLISIADNGYFYLAFNQKKEPMNMLAFRKAVSHCIDKETIIQRYMGGYGQAGDSVEPPFWTDWYNSSVEHYPFNLDTARQVLQEAGFSWDTSGNLLMPDGKHVPSLVILTPPADYDPIRIKAGEMIANNLRKIGIDATAKPLDFDVLVAKMNSFDYDMLIIGWSLSSDPIGNVFDILGPKASQNYFAFWSENNDNPWYNKIGGVSTKADAETQAYADKVQWLGEQAKTTFDREKQIYYTKWAQGVLSKAIPVNVLYYRVNNFAVSKTWNGWVPFLGELISGYSIAALTRTQAQPPVGEAITALLNVPDKLQYGVETTATALVFDKDGKAVEGATVTLSGDGFDIPNATVTTGSDGMATIALTPVQVGYLTLQVTATSGANSFTTQKIVSVVKAKPDVLFMTASPEKVFLLPGETSTITLKVVDQEGAPVEGAQIELDLGLMGYGEVDHSTVTTGADGTATMVYTAPSELPLNKHAEVRLSLSVSKEGYASDMTSTVTQYLVIKNTEPSQWQYIAIEDVTSFACNETNRSSTITFKVLDQDGNPLSGETISVMYSNEAALESPVFSVDTNETGYGVLTATFSSELNNTTATQIWLKNELVLTSIGAGVTILFKGSDAPEDPIYGGIIHYGGEPILNPDSGAALNFTIELYDLNGEKPTGTVPVGFIIGAPPQGSTAALKDAPDYIYSSLWDYAGIQVFTDLDSGAVSTGGYFLSDLLTDEEINELNEGLYDSWQSLQDEWWTFVDYENMKGLDVVDGEATIQITPDTLVLSDSMPSIIIVPMAKAGFYVTPDYSNFYWVMNGKTAFMTEFVVQRTQMMLSVKYEMEQGLVKDMGENNSFDLSITVINQANEPVEGVDVEVFVQAYGTGSFFSAEVAGPTNETGMTTATVSGLSSTTYRSNTLILTTPIKQPLYIEAVMEGYASVFASTEIYNVPVELFATVSGPMMVEYEGSATYTLTVLDENGNPVEGATVDISVDVGTVEPTNGTTDSSGTIQFTYTASGLTGVFAIPVIKTGATMDGYGAASTTYNLLAYNTVPEVTVDIPSEGVTINETTFTVSGTVSDPDDVSQITVSIDGGEPINVTLTGNSFSYTFTNLTEGPHTITITVVDSQGVETTYQYTVTVQKPEKPTKPKEELPWLWIVIAIIIVLVIVAVAAMMMKKKPAEEKVEE